MTSEWRCPPWLGSVLTPKSLLVKSGHQWLQPGIKNTKLCVRKICKRKMYINSWKQKI